jgi:transcriptional regulator with XRE-family HTH domain
MFIKNNNYPGIIVSMSERKFIQWVTEEKNRLGWGVNELARRAELSNSYVSNVLNNQQSPGPKFYRGMARAFEVSEITLRRMGGDLPPAVGDTANPTIRQIWEMLQRMDDAELKEIQRYARYIQSTRSEDLSDADTGLASSRRPAEGEV